MAHQPSLLTMPGIQQPPQQQAKVPIPARIITPKDGGPETLSNGELLYTHQFVRSRALGNPFALHDACEIGDLFFVKAFFQLTPDGRPNPLMTDNATINKRDLYAQTPLHLAILHGRYEIARILLKNGADATIVLEGSPQLHVLLTLIGSFPQYQVPMLQPTPILLQQTVKYLQQQIQSDSTSTTSTTQQPTLPTPSDLLLNPKFAQFQSYGIRMLSLLLQSLQFNPRQVLSRDDNGRTIFHICAQYDLIEPFLVLIDRLYTNPMLSNGIRFDSPNITPEEIELLQHRQRSFCIALFATDNLHRNIFHYCAQYRSYHFLQRAFEFISTNVTKFPPLGITPMNEAEVITDLTTVYDVYHRSPLHYAYFYAAPFYSRISSLSKLLGTYRGVNTYEVTHATSNNDTTTTTTSMGDNNNITTPSKYGFGIDYDHNYAQLESDPIIRAFLTMNDKIQTAATEGIEGYSNLVNIIGQPTGLDLYQRTPYQTAVFNQPIIGTDNAGTMPAMNINDLQDENGNKLAKKSFGKMKPTLIGWSPRCFEHHTAQRISRRDEAPPPENVRRLQVLLNFTDGVLRSNEFNHRVTQTDILALNHLYYATLISELAKTIANPNQQPNDNIVIQSLPIGHFTADSSTCSSTILRLGDSDAIVPSTENEQQLLQNTLSQIFTSTPVIPQNTLHWNHRAPRATFSDVLRCHDYSYITRLMSMTENVEEQYDWTASTTESIDVLHRDLHISVPTIPSLPLHKLKSTYQTTMDYYFHVLDTAQKYSLLPPHEVTNTNAFNNPTGTIDLIKKRNQVMAPLSHLTQTILYRERSLLNLNLGFANLQIPQLLSSNGTNEYDLATKLYPNDLINTQQTIHTRSELLADGHELYDSALFPIQVYRELSKNMQTGVSNWRMQLTPSIYTNSIIQSSSLVNILYHYPNHEALGILIDKHTGLPIQDPNMIFDDNDSIIENVKNAENVRVRERTSTYTGELSSTTPAPSITRHQPPIVPLKNLDEDTSLSAFSWFAALFAGGTVIDAVKRVVHGQYKNAFCAVRPPGHHSGPMGLVATDENIGDSHGFCLLNNVAMGAAYAKTIFPDIIKRVAIVDFDVHHGNGTEAIVRTLQPRIVHKVINLQMNTQFGFQDSITLNRQTYTPWHDSQDADEVLFASVHGYHKHNNEQFYPGTGATTKGILQALIDMNSDPYRIIAQNIELTEEERLLFFSSTISSRTAAVDLLRKCIDKREEMTKTGEGVKQYVSPVLLDIFDGDEDKAYDFVKNNRSLESQSQKVQRGLHQMLQGITNLQQQQQQQQLSSQNDIFGQSSPSFDNEHINLPPSIYPGDLPTDLPLHLALDERKNRILNAGLGKQTKEQWRQVWQHTIIPGIVAHKPDLIMISAGFDAHHRDKINSGHVGVDEDDFYWITRQLMKVANLCCEGRIVSCLEGGYRIHCGFASPFARSVAAHVRALHEGGNEPWTPEDVHVEVQIAHERDQWKQALDRFTERERENIRLQQEMQYRREAMAVANNNNTTMGDDDIDTTTTNNNNGFNPIQTTIDPMTGEFITTTTQPPNDLEAINTSNIIASTGGRTSRQRSPVDYNALNKAFNTAKKQKANPTPKSTETTTPTTTTTTETTTTTTPPTDDTTVPPQ